MNMVCPWTYPKSRSPSKNAPNLVDCNDPGSNVRKQSLGSLFGCCARAAIGQRIAGVAAPPSKVMNSRRLMCRLFHVQDHAQIGSEFGRSNQEKRAHGMRSEEHTSELQSP